MKKVAMLLVGNGARHALSLRNYLERRGCVVSSATSCQEAASLIKTRHFDVVLSEFLLPGGTAYRLVPLLQGTDTAMFFSNAVEDGCWWMNAVYEGRDCTDEPGMRTMEFRVRLNEILSEKLFRSANGSSDTESSNGPAEAELPGQRHSFSSQVRTSPEDERHAKS